MGCFFISGCQRYGTTMHRLILESHRSIKCFDEAAGCDLLVRESIRYESLVGSPKSVLLKLSRFLGVSWSDSLLRHPEHPHAEIDENGIEIGETNPRRNIDTKSIGGHRNLMTEQQIQEVRYYVEDFSNKITRVLPA